MARPKEEELGEDFSYILRMADTDMDGLKALATALTAVKGVGPRTAIQICKNTDSTLHSCRPPSAEQQETSVRLLKAMSRQSSLDAQPPT